METNKVRQRGPNNTPPTSDILRKKSIKDKDKRMSDVVIYGKSSQGKTCTLQHLAVLLLSGGVILNPVVVDAFESTFWNGKTYDDFRILIPYKRENDGKSVMIYLSTTGDNWLIVEDNFEFFYQHFIRKGKHIYIFDAASFIKWEDLTNDRKGLLLADRPSICISPANFNNGAIQAQRYYLDATHNDWKRERWILKERENNPGAPLQEYINKVIKKSHDNIAKEIVKIIHDFMDNTIV